MNPDQTREAVKIMSAYAEGAQIQVSTKSADVWANVEGFRGETPSWNWEGYRYRVEPPAPKAPEDYWIVLSKPSMRPISVPFLSREQAEEFVQGGASLYEIIHVCLVAPEKPRPEKWSNGDRVVLARFSSKEEYDAYDGPGWDDDMEMLAGKTGTVRSAADTLYVKVLFDGEDVCWAILNQDLDPA